MRKDLIKYRKPVIYTCVTNGYSDVNPPPNILKDDFDFLLLSPDNVKCEGWESLSISVPATQSNRRLAKFPKIQPWNFFDANLSIWIDANMIINVSEFIHIFGLFSKSDATFGLCAHNKRDTLDQEFDDVSKRLKDDPDLINKQRLVYEETQEINTSKLFHGGLLMRKHSNLELNILMRNWQSQIDQYSVRDQLSLSYLLDQKPSTKIMIFEAPVTKIVSQKPHLKFTSDHKSFRGTQIVKWKFQVLVYKALTNKLVRWLKSKLK
jgi:hypothetical protein